jgi:hypothetical protein
MLRQETGVNQKDGKRPASLVRLDAKFKEVISTVARAGARPAQIAEWPSAVECERVQGPVTEPGIISGMWRVKP